MSESAKTKARCESVIESILELCNSGKQVSFLKDWGGNTLTVYVNDHHFHAGGPDGSFKVMVADLCRELAPAPQPKE